MTKGSSFQYECPLSLEELRGAISRLPLDRTGFLAGGTDLLIAVTSGKHPVERIIDLKRIPGMKGIEQREEGIWIGSLTSIHALERNEIILSHAKALAEGAETLGSWQIRNRATIGGNLGNASPTADTAPPLLALDAQVLTWGLEGERTIPIGSFWVSAGKSSLNKGEIITGVLIPLHKESSSAYMKLGPREAMDITVASAAAVVRVKEGNIDYIRLALGGAAPTPIRARSAENYLLGKPADSENLLQAGLLAAEDSNPRDSMRASRDYRLRVIPGLVQKAVEHALRKNKTFLDHDLLKGQGGEA
ncbi:MAG: FAD binding domain-containing protein [Dehalobacterium sp.]